MSDDYPHNADLQKIREWDIIKDPIGLMDFIEETYIYEYGKINKVKKGDCIQYTLITGGWSGNEDIIAALPSQFYFFYHTKWERGGHWEFEIPKHKEEK